METVTALDIAPLLAGRTAPALDRALGETIAREGGVALTGLAEGAALDRTVGALQRFFTLPEAERGALALRKRAPGNPNLYRGFTPLPEGPHWSYQEIFDIGPEPPLGAPEDLPSHAAFTEANVWPGEAALPGWRAGMLGHWSLCHRVGRAVIAAAARGLGLDPAPFDALAAGRNGTLRLLHYPPVPPGFTLLEADGETAQNATGGARTIAREHVDTGIASVLWQGPEGGLEMQGRDGVWRRVAPGPGRLSFHCGDLLEALGGPDWQATPHRVIGGQGERFSCGFFLEPGFTTRIAPPGGAAPKTYAAHLTDAFPTRFLEPA